LPVGGRHERHAAAATVPYRNDRAGKAGRAPKSQLDLQREAALAAVIFRYQKEQGISFREACEVFAEHGLNGSGFSGLFYRDGGEKRTLPTGRAIEVRIQRLRNSPLGRRLIDNAIRYGAPPPEDYLAKRPSWMDPFKGPVRRVTVAD
jgi:hypothetical protein